MVRAQDRDNMLAFYASTTYYGESSWWSKKDGDWYLLTKGRPVDTTDVTIRVEVRGDLYAAHVNGERGLSITDPTFETGRVGLGLYCSSDSNCNSLDHFKVEALPD